MNLVFEVVFNCTITPAQSGDFFNSKQETPSLKDLRAAVKSVKSKLPFTVYVERKVNIIDKDEPIPKELYTLASRIGGTDEYRTVHHDEHFSFIVADKLLYPNDVRKILKKQYGSTLDLDRQRLTEETPVLYSGVVQNHRVGLKDKNGNPTTYTLKWVLCRNLHNTDIVLDRNLCQIWPDKTKEVPSELLEIFAKIKENVR